MSDINKGPNNYEQIIYVQKCKHNKYHTNKTQTSERKNK